MKLAITKEPLVSYSPREQVAFTVKNWILQGELSPGSSVPPEEELSRQLKVARGTIRSGLDLLEQKGFIVKRKRRRYVAEKSEAPSHMASSPLQDTVLLLGTTTNDLMNYKDTGFLQAVQAGALDALSQKSIHALNLHADKLDKTDIKALLQLKPLGAVIFQEVMMSEAGRELARQVKSYNVPLILDYDDYGLEDYDTVVCDHKQSNYDLTNLLIEKGYKDILCFYPSNSSYWLREKTAGYTQAMKEHGLEAMKSPDEYKLKDFNKVNKENFDIKVRMTAGHLVEYFSGERPPQVIMASSDLDVPVINTACRLFGKTPGTDILITGYDNKMKDNLWSEFDNTFPFATVEKNNTAIGMTLVDILKKRINNEFDASAVKIKLSGKIITF